MVSCLRLPREILCWILNSVILAVLLAYVVQALVTGVAPWDDFVAFITPGKHFIAYAAGSLLAVYIVAASAYCIHKFCSGCPRWCRCRCSRCSTRQREDYDLLPLSLFEESDDDDEEKQRGRKHERWQPPPRP